MFSVKVVNLETIIDTQSIRAKQILHRKHKGGSLKSFTLTIPWNLAKLVKIFLAIKVRRHHTDQKQMGLLKEQCAK